LAVPCCLCGVRSVTEVRLSAFISRPALLSWQVIQYQTVRYDVLPLSPAARNRLSKYPPPSAPSPPALTIRPCSLPRAGSRRDSPDFVG
uniref:Uncharacterized protein n=1 Tax=Chelonoidis abingdonii TaxID=106734 RepID=A0A8C0QI55_CHEAB